MGCGVPITAVRPRDNPPMQWTAPEDKLSAFESRSGTGSATDRPNVRIMARTGIVE
jgi:hypothetical protein